MDADKGEQAAETGKHRRWLLGLEPILEGGWLHKGARARTWDVESELIGIALLGDVTSHVPQMPEGGRGRAILIHGHPIFGDVTSRVADEPR